MKIAVVGSGISGLGATWILGRLHKIHLYESDSRLGGHANTVQVRQSDRDIPIDTGFLVYNELTYPNLVGFFSELGVETVESDMSLSIQIREQNLEWSGTDLSTVFAQKRNILRPSFLRMLSEILRFGREAEINLLQSRRNAWSLGELLQLRKYSAGFMRDYLLPIGAAIWSTPQSKMLEFPAESFLQFFINHRLLQISDRPIWRTVRDGSVQYVKRAAERAHQIFLQTPVFAVERTAEGVKVLSSKGEEIYDKVVLATHAPQSAKILRNQSEEEARILNSFSYEPNRAVLHKNSSVMPKLKKCWASWNAVGASDFLAQKEASLTYHINRLQPIYSKTDYFVSLNPSGEIEQTIQTFAYEHPHFDRKSLEAQKSLSRIQGNGGVHFAGAWTRYGFHEDGLKSAVDVATSLGVLPSWIKEKGIQ